ncbi:hypothetical protein Bca4012_012568 [Brassica carinata]
MGEALSLLLVQNLFLYLLLLLSFGDYGAVSNSHFSMKYGVMLHKHRRELNEVVDGIEDLCKTHYEEFIVAVDELCGLCYLMLKS